MSRRAAIAMSDAEVKQFIAEQRVATCATIGPRGRPHLMPLWYLPEDLAVVCWTYARSQKARNLERVPQATVQIEAGQIYRELRAVMMECDVEMIRDLDEVASIGAALAQRYGGPDGVPGPEAVAAMRMQAPKRVGLRFRPSRIVSFDHRKLGGAY
jgi:PPOX class probable F420-dependent enzyme